MNWCFWRKPAKRRHKAPTYHGPRVFLKPRFVHTIPSDHNKILEGVLYISMRFNTVVHKCPCGCGRLVEVVLHPARRSLTYDGEFASLTPSIGANLPCCSHYFITRNEVRWCNPIPQSDRKWYEYDRDRRMREYEGKSN